MYADFATLSIIVLYVIMWMLFFIFTLRTIMKIFSKTIEGFCRNETSSAQRQEVLQLTQAMQSITNFRTRMTISSIFLVAELVLTMAFGLKHLYIFYNIGQVSLVLGMIIIQLEFLKTVSQGICLSGTCIPDVVCFRRVAWHHRWIKRNILLWRIIYILVETAGAQLFES